MQEVAFFGRPDDNLGRRRQEFDLEGAVRGPHPRERESDLVFALAVLVVGPVRGNANVEPEVSALLEHPRGLVRRCLDQAPQFTTREAPRLTGVLLNSLVCRCHRLDESESRLLLR